MIILSVDQSTSACGFCKIIKGKIKASGVEVFKGENATVRIALVKQWLVKMLKKHKPDFVAVEEVPPTAKGKAHEVLNQLFGVVENVLYESDVGYIKLPVATWRKYCGIKARNRVEQKAEAIQFVKDTFGIDCGEDEADAICIAWYIQGRMKDEA